MNTKNDDESGVAALEMMKSHGAKWMVMGDGCGG
jgi:hypothetical protein